MRYPDLDLHRRPTHRILAQIGHHAHITHQTRCSFPKRSRSMEKWGASPESACCNIEVSSRRSDRKEGCRPKMNRSARVPFSLKLEPRLLTDVRQLQRNQRRRPEHVRSIVNLIIRSGEGCVSSLHNIFPFATTIALTAILKSTICDTQTEFACCSQLPLL